MKRIQNIIKAVWLPLLVTAVMVIIVGYFTLPANTIYSSGAYLLGLFGVVIFSVIYSIKYHETYEDEDGKIVMISWACATIMFVLMIVISFTGGKMLNSKKYANKATVIESDFNKDIPTYEDVDKIALIDTDSAHKMGNRTIGELSKVVSQYELSKNMTTITVNGQPKKVCPLEYASVFRWSKNRKDGIPGYIIVDAETGEAEYVKLDKPMMASPSGYFEDDLTRQLRRKYLSAIFQKSIFEIDDEGNPYWVTMVVSPKVSLWGCKTIDEVIITDATTGSSEKVKVADVPSWVDIVYDGDYIVNLYNWKGLFEKGYWNSLTSKTGCTRTTTVKDEEDNYVPDFGYIAINGRIWVYTGVTSVASDSSNVAVIMADCQTGEIMYYPVAGADEQSAMEAAQGEVQQFGYTASFPSLININGEPAYIMVLTDANHIVKSYAIVNLKNYSKIAVAETKSEVFKLYSEKMGYTTNDEVDVEQTKQPKEEPKTEALKEISFSVDYIEYIVTNGNTTVYIYTEDGKVYKSEFNEDWILTKKGDVVNAKINADSNEKIPQIY